jgi:hydrogenase large subunit
MARIVIDPLTRISGFLGINADVEENTITDVQAQGFLYRGFEVMLRGRPPLDAVYFNERICGICSAAHSYASSLALDQALNITVPINERYLRDIIHGFEFIQNHLRHFYLMVFPDYVKMSSLPIADINRFQDFRLPQERNSSLEEHYGMGIEYARLAHEGQAVLAGKAPHNHGIFAGGTTTDITAYKLEKVKSTIQRLLSFVSNVMVEDAGIIADYYPDYYELGISYPNFMSYGAFSYEDSDITYVHPGVLVNGQLSGFQAQDITKHIEYAWYQQSGDQELPDMNKANAYTFIKAPRYQGMAMEVGPLARMLISGNYNGGHSCMDRIYARALETEKILQVMNALVDRITLRASGQQKFIIPNQAQGAGLLDTTRGSLGHWISINNQVIEHYDIITPSNWNLSPLDENGVHGTVENALIGTVLSDTENPVEIGRIVRSYDPCVSCATHLIGKNGFRKDIEHPV